MKKAAYTTHLALLALYLLLMGVLMKTSDGEMGANFLFAFYLLIIVFELLVLGSMMLIATKALHYKLALLAALFPFALFVLLIL